MSALIDERDFLPDNLDHLATMARFAEEVAAALSTSPDRSLSPDGWAGFSLVLGMVREGLEELSRTAPLE